MLVIASGWLRWFVSASWREMLVKSLPFRLISGCCNLLRIGSKPILISRRNVLFLVRPTCGIQPG